MLTAEERQLLCDHLRTTSDRLIHAIDGISEAEWNFAPASGGWSICGVAEHLAVVEQNTLAKVRGPLLESAPTPEEVRAKAPQRDRLILERLPFNRETKVQAGAASSPCGRWTAAADLLAAFRSARAQTIEYASTTEDDLRGHFSTHSALRDLDGYQWLLLLGSHCARHVAQIEEVRNSPGFPQRA